MTVLRSHQRRWLALLALGAALLAEGLFRSGALNPVEQRLQDAWFQWQGKRAVAQHVVIVAIDEDTLAAYPDDPMVFWTDRLATVVGRLRAAGASVVGLDMLLSISPERWLGKLGSELQQAARDYDRPFREEVNSGRLVLVATRSGSGARESDYLLPSPDYLLALPDFDIPGYIGLGDLPYSGPTAALTDVWRALRASMRSVLEETSLADVAAGSLPRHVAGLAGDYLKQEESRGHG